MALALVALVAFLITAPNHALAFLYVTSQSPQLQTFDDTTAPYSPVQIRSLSTTQTTESRSTARAGTSPRRSRRPFIFMMLVSASLVA